MLFGSVGRCASAGFAGLELTTRLSKEFGEGGDVVLIDGRDGFVFGFSKLDVMFGRTDAPSVHHPYRDFVKPGVRFVQWARVLHREGRLRAPRRPRGLRGGPGGRGGDVDTLQVPAGAGQGRVAKVEVTFLSGQVPAGTFEEASSALAADKAEFAACRIRRRFGRDWSAFIR